MFGPSGNGGCELGFVDRDAAGGMVALLLLLDRLVMQAA
jgi:hypothetical protein